MKFSVHLTAEERRFLCKEYNDYIAKTDMTEPERNELHDWVSRGNSPYGNPANIADEKGYEMDFISGIRTIIELAEEAG